MTAREFTREERAELRKLITSMCANYDREYGCLPLECECCMLIKWWTGGYCRYFREAVLPLDPALTASLMGITAPVRELCAVCGKTFVAEWNQKYCSRACQREGNRRKSRDRMRKRRDKKNED